jgi:superfamily II DNA or RNA helicase
VTDVVLFEHQEDFLDVVEGSDRHLLFYKTGAGKSLTAMLGMKKLGQTYVVVIAPPSTHDTWMALGNQLDMAVRCMSHAKFRMKDTKLSRTVAVIADEFHMFGGHKGQGWKKLDALGRHLKAPLFLLSATPNYNDAERVYCIQHVMDPLSCRGGYLEFLYTHCVTEQNPFGMEPRVLGFHRFNDAAEYLVSLPHVHYLPDDTVINIMDVDYEEHLPPGLEGYGYDSRKGSMVASIIERRHAERVYGLVTELGQLQPEVHDLVVDMVAHTTSLLFAQHTSVVEAIARSLDKEGIKYAVVTGDTPLALKARIIQEFRDGVHDILIGTATLATGTDGLDKVCDTLVIVDDTDDDALRRQLIGRIMPRGAATNSASKRIYRLVPIPA